MNTREWSAPKWVNTEPDAGAVGALLARCAGHIAPATIDELWVFPTRRGGGVESTVFVVATFTGDPERRDVLTARFTVSRDRKGRATIEDRIDSHATAPAGAVSRVVDGVLRRLGDDAAHPPRLEKIGGDAQKFAELVVELGGTAEDPPSVSNPNPNSKPDEVGTGPDPSDASGSDSDSDSSTDSTSASASAPAPEGVARGESIGYQ